MARVKRLFTGDVSTQRRRSFAYHSRRFRDVGCEPTLPRNRHRQLDRPRRKMRDRRHRACGDLLRNNHTRMKSTVDAVPDVVQPRFCPHCGSGLGWGQGSGMNTFSIDCSKSSYFAIEACSVSAARARNIVQLIVVVLGAASLAACAESTAVRNSNFVSPSRQASLPHDRTASFVTHRRVASVRKHTPFARHYHATPTQVASQGIASFYTEDQ